MTIGTNEPPPGPAAPDIILLALFQSRLRERSVYLGKVIQTQRRRLSDRGPLERSGNVDADSATLAQIRRAEQALNAVRQAQERIGLGRYGLCDECQEPIAWDDLLEAPEQTVCSACTDFEPSDRVRLRS